MIFSFRHAIDPTKALASSLVVGIQQPCLNNEPDLPMGNILGRLITPRSSRLPTQYTVTDRSDIPQFDVPAEFGDPVRIHNTSDFIFGGEVDSYSLR